MRQRHIEDRIKGMTFLGKLVLYSGAGKYWKDGDALSFIWRWYHPLTWVFAPVFLLLAILITGIPYVIKNSYDMGIGLSDYWKDHRNEREFISLKDIWLRLVSRSIGN